ncbi:WD domain, G-beta repeat [Musa troglodytarum]|uniref:WD domain, G-beta repeat n=1 Tax=Musa troglodytarum TaxID=320322 RepID=A0A9E7F5F9_9LILI|nr:WD domain, G-beta repeat [Musa troglodytarum]
MAAYEGGGGIGGKFPKRPFRRAPATPYERPPAAVRPARGHPAETRGNGWLSKLVDPASRIIARSASRLFSSVFQKRLGPPPAAAPQATAKSVEEVSEEHFTVPKEEAALPTEIAKAYMSSRPFKVSPANLTGQNKLFHEDKALPSGTPYGKKISDRPMALRSAVCISGPPETKPNIYINPKLNGRTAIYKMSRSPYFKPHLMGDKLLMDGYGGPSSSSQSMSANIVHSGGRQMLKRRSSVLDDDIGSFGPTRRTRQKSNLMSPLKSSYSSVGHFLPSSSTRVDRGSIIPRHKLYHLNEQKNNHAESQTSENGGMPIVPVPLQSSEMARKILQQLDKLAPSPKEKSSKLKIDTNDSPHMLTQNMLGGRALKSMEEIDTSKFLNVQVNGSLEVASESHQEGYVISYKKDETEENASTEHAVKGVHVVSTASILKKPNIVGTEANPTVATANVAVVPGADTIFTGKKPSFQMSAPEDLDMLDDDIYNIKNSSSPAVIVDNKSKSNSEVEIIHVAKTNLEKSVESSSIGMHVSTAILDRDPQKINNCSSTDKMDGFPFPAVPASNSFQLPSVCPMLVASLEKSATQNEEVTASTNKIVLNTHSLGSPSTYADSSVSKFAVSTMPCPSIAVSHAAPALSTTSSFQFNTGGFLGASSPVISSTEKCGPANLIESDKSSTFSISSSATLGTSAATSVSVSMISSSSALPVSPLFSTASDFLAGSTSSSFSTSSSGLFSFGASSQSSGAKSLIFSNNPQSLTKFGDTAGSTFSTQLAVSGTGMSNLLPSSSGTFGSSTPVPIFGTSDTSSSGSASSSFGFSTSATKPLSSSSSFCFSSVTGSSSNSGSISTFVPATNFGSSSSFPFSGATVSSLGAGSSNSLVSTPPFGSSSFSFSTGGTLSTKFGDNNSSVGGTGIALFSSSSQTSQSSVSASTFGSTISAPATGFPFASPHSGSSPFTFGASVPAFSFTSIGSTNSSTSSAQPVFGVPNQIASLNSPGNDQMNVEDSMADDPAQSISPAATFGQPNLLASPNFMFGAPAAPGGLSTFQFGSQQNSFVPQSQSPFQQSVNADFAGGGSFSLGSSGGEKSGRRIVRVRRDKHRKKLIMGGPSSYGAFKLGLFGGTDRSASCCAALRVASPLGSAP